MPPPAISTRGAREGSSFIGIGTVFGSGVEELVSFAGASATAFAATTRGAAASCCCLWERDEDAATRVEDGDASRDERGEERIGASDDERHPAALLEAAAARPVTAAVGSGIALREGEREGRGEESLE